MSAKPATPTVRVYISSRGVVEESVALPVVAEEKRIVERLAYGFHPIIVPD